MKCLSPHSTLIVRWPRALPPARVIGEPVIHMDLAATILAAAGVAVDERAPLDGRDLTPLMRGERPSGSPPLF